MSKYDYSLHALPTEVFKDINYIFNIYFMHEFNLDFFYVAGNTYSGNEVRREAFIVIEYLLNILFALFDCFFY